MILNKKLLTCEGIRSENWKDTWSSLSVMTTSEQCSEGEGGRGHYTLHTSQPAGPGCSWTTQEILSRPASAIFAWHNETASIYCMNSAQYMLHLRCWTVEHNDSQTSKAKIVSASIYFLPLFLFYRRLVGGAVWELVQRSLATSPLYLLWVLTAEQLACPAPHHTAQLFHKVSLSYHRFLVFVSEAWVPGFCESQATQHQPHQARTVQNQGGWMYLCLRQAVSC